MDTPNRVLYKPKGPRISLAAQQRQRLEQEQTEKQRAELEAQRAQSVTPSDGEGSIPVTFLHQRKRWGRFVRFSETKEDVKKVEKALLCVSCGRLPNPKYYYICDKCDRFICGSCTYVQTPVEKDEVGGGAFGGGFKIKTCCEDSVPTKGHARFFGALIQNSHWECENKCNGCVVKVKGFEYEDHVQSCVKRKELHCYYPRGCGFTCQRTEVIVDHLLEVHGGQVHHSKDDQVEIDVQYKEDELGPVLGVLKFHELFYILGTEISKSELHIWVWDINSDERKTKCFFTIQPASEPERGGELSSSMTCVPYEVPPKEIIENEECFTVDLGRLKRKHLWRSNNHKVWTLIVKI